ncbi:hypothetical protein GOODEAATRI_018613 [Goodea atripinnis]|uniref:Uncharacterized protein n=1 Tax=Goodea atripinnis TaxID=208336 RepID=A0ABV0NVU1_9TELE
MASSRQLTPNMLWRERNRWWRTHLGVPICRPVWLVWSKVVPVENHHTASLPQFHPVHHMREPLHHHTWSSPLAVSRLLDCCPVSPQDDRKMQVPILLALVYQNGELNG